MAFYRRGPCQRAGKPLKCSPTSAGPLAGPPYPTLVPPLTAIQSAAPSRAAFIFIFITLVLDVLALGVVIPVLPKLVETFLAGDTAAAARMVGFFSLAWALMQFLCSPLLGALSDRFGRRP